jgi:hypothetical protein
MPWEPPPHEADLFCNVYVDESSQTKHRYLVIGGLVVPLSHAALFEADIAAARSNTFIPVHRPDGTPRVMKRQKVNQYNLDIYKKIVEVAFHFRRLRNFPARKNMGLHCVIVNTSIKPLFESGDGDIEVGFDKEFHFLCTVIVPKRYRTEFFALYPDRRHAKRPLNEARDIMNRSVYKYGDRRRGLLRVLEFKDPETCQALQVTDILIGALAYRLNGHYEAPHANRAKIALCDHIWRLCKLGDPFNTSPFHRRPFISWLHRPAPPNPPKRIRLNYYQG